MEFILNAQEYRVENMFSHSPTNLISLFQIQMYEARKIGEYLEFGLFSENIQNDPVYLGFGIIVLFHCFRML